ncbi:hypothetical protein PAAG_12402 [Paracoccidioides lutzii Pb01]|uniref:Uncharacterized protein n=1 Tax=Paracoccidioides lutzii (strain ATCC MYA-826 / Pb01) TaxID=502779 RepID=A0A0A2UZC1_PARBA|nr:hypothetical protein PAAG_12402 [Paracoccidioides lutzii Pb01]KGQ00931.1 hypothetical protein PAAG_12402 [Paracoccidioides lutzii Pb01]
MQHRHTPLPSPELQNPFCHVRRAPDIHIHILECSTPRTSPPPLSRLFSSQNFRTLETFEEVPQRGLYCLHPLRKSGPGPVSRQQILNCFFRIPNVIIREGHDGTLHALCLLFGAVDYWNGLLDSAVVRGLEMARDRSALPTWEVLVA